MQGVLPVQVIQTRRASAPYIPGGHLDYKMNDDVEGENESLLRRSDGNRKSSLSRAHTTLLFALCFVAGFVSGVQYSGSYLIEPVKAACPSWSESATVYGEAGIFGTTVFFGMLIGALVRVHPYPTSRYLVVSLLLIALSFGTCAVTVATCESVHSALQAVYVFSFSLVGAAFSFTCVPLANSLVAWLPRHGGALGSMLMTGCTLGSIAFSQYFLKMQSLVKSGVVDVPTVFLFTGIIGVLLTAPLLFLLKHPAEVNADNVSFTEEDHRQKSKKVIAMKKFWILVTIRLVTLIPGFGLISRQQTILETMWKGSSAPPLQLLAFLAQLIFVVGAVIPFFISDKIGVVHTWILSLTLQAFCLGLLTLFTPTSGLISGYAAIVLYFIFNGAFAAPKALSFGISAEYFGVDRAGEGYGMLQLGFGGGGLLGPILFETMYMHLNHNYEPFLYISFGLTFVGCVAIMLSRPSSSVS